MEGRLSGMRFTDGGDGGASCCRCEEPCLGNLSCNIFSHLALYN
jgi:hypothetical protein